MIALTDNEQRPLRLINPGSDQWVGFHPKYGFLSEGSARSRQKLKARQGIHDDFDQWGCRFRIDQDDSGGMAIAAIDGCTVTAREQGRWALEFSGKEFQLMDAALVPPVTVASDREKRSRAPEWVSLALVLLLPMVFIGAYIMDSSLTEEEELVELQKLQEKQKTVVIPRVKVRPAKKKVVAAKVIRKKAKQPGAAIKNKLGFLALLGKQDLKKAMGGMPTEAKKRSPGAGFGGDQGSGGELLAGLGKGVRHTTVGNTGVAGLGGIGKAGAGGGEGGFGSSYIGSGGGGGGRVLSDVSLSDDVVLEGGLDRAVIKATIAKYLSQVRACYEKGLRKKPDLTGQVTMAFEIGGGGRLNYARVGKTSLGDKGVENCISRVMLSWQFPKPVGGVDVQVSYPFMLRPANYM